MLARALLAASLCLALCASARAGEPTLASASDALSRPEAARASRHAYGRSYDEDAVVRGPAWYGWQIWGADLLAFSLGMAVQHPLGFAVPYLAAGPLIHVANGESSSAAASVGLRGAAPIVGALVGYAVETSMDCGGNEFCGLAGLAFGFAGGLLGASLIDGAVLAHRSDDAYAARRTESSSTLVLAPFVTMANGGLGLGARGAF